MSKEKTQQKLLLQEQLFKALKTNDTELNAKISRACEGIAGSVIDFLMTNLLLLKASILTIWP